MSYAPVQIFSTTIATAGTFSSALDLGKSFSKINLVIPTMSSGADMQVYASETLSGTYRVMFHQPTVTSGAVSFVIASTVTNCIVPLPNIHVQYVKVAVTTATTGQSYAYSLICSDA